MKNRIFSLLLVLVLALGLVPAASAAQEDGIRVAVVDTGISTKAVSSDGILPGKNYVLPDGDTEDRLGHGTAISAIIVGSTAARITGICPTAKLVPLVTSSQDETGTALPGDTAMAAQAIRDAVDRYGCRIINISSGAATSSWQLRNAVTYAQEQGALIIASAGNSQKTNPGAVYYPGGYDGVLCVGAANEDGSVASYSQRNDKVDLLALGSMRVASIKGTRIKAYGTSYATAIVTGAAAQIWTNHPELTADQVREAILSSTRTVDGWPVLDLEAALAWNAEETAPIFSDVPEDAYYYDAVHWAVENGVTNGVSATEFAPNTDCTQAHILTFLWRAAGSPVPSADNRYTNDAVKEGDYFYQAYLWAWEKGLIPDGAPDPKAACSRSDVVTYLWKLAGSPAADPAAFDDVTADTPYSAAVAWAVEQKVTNGVSTTRFGPDETCTRAQIVTFLHRYFVE